MAANLRLLFFLRAINLDRVFESALRELLRRGHVVHVVLEREKRGLPEGAGVVFGALEAEFPDFSYEQLPEVPPTAGERLATDARLALDYLRYLEPEYDAAPALRERARRNAPKRFVRFLDRRLGSRRFVRPVLTGLESRSPVPARLTRLIREYAPDVVLLSPLVELGSPQVDVVRAAGELGIPTVLLVASWDNLTNKGRIKEPPSLTVVWNEAQVDEAQRLHGIPRDRVTAVGAHTFDHWFGWEPSVDAGAFASAVGLDPGRPFLLYTCSSTFVAREEAAFVEEWLGRLRSHPDERLAEVGVVIRPHPQGVTKWAGFAGAEPGRTVVWPEVGETPGDDRRKRDYFHSLTHATAVVGINTSAFIEAAILGRPVYTLVGDQFRATQEGTLHFAHLADVLVAAHSWDEHLDQLARVLAEPGHRREPLERFVRSFVRPAGLDRPAAPLLADAVETAARLRGRRAHRAGLVGAAWPLSARLAQRT
jgi:hypothetical protein